MKNSNFTNKNTATPGTTTNKPKTGASTTGSTWNTTIGNNKTGQATTGATAVTGKNRDPLITGKKDKTGNH